MNENDVLEIIRMIRGLPEADHTELLDYIREFCSKRNISSGPEKKKQDWNRIAGTLTDEEAERMSALIKESDYFCPLEDEINDQNIPDAMRCGKNILRLPVTIDRDEDTGFSVASCLLLEGCVSQGKNRDEAIRNLLEAAAGWIQIFYERVRKGEFGDHEIDIVLVDGKAYVYPKGKIQE